MRSAPAEVDAQVRILDVRLLSDDWYVLKKTTFERRRRDGTWQRLSRETCDRGNGAALLLFNAEHGTVLLTRQFRFPTYVNGCADGMLIEACAGLLDGDDPRPRFTARLKRRAAFACVHHASCSRPT
jgi:hypothetical protein